MSKSSNVAGEPRVEDSVAPRTYVGRQTWVRMKITTIGKRMLDSPSSHDRVSRDHRDVRSTTTAGEGGAIGIYNRGCRLLTTSSHEKLPRIDP